MIAFMTQARKAKRRALLPDPEEFNNLTDSEVLAYTDCIDPSMDSTMTNNGEVMHMGQPRAPAQATDRAKAFDEAVRAARKARRSGKNKAANAEQSSAANKAQKKAAKQANANRKANKANKRNAKQCKKAKKAQKDRMSESQMLKQNEMAAIKAENAALKQKLRELDMQKKAARQQATAQIKFIKQQFKDAFGRLEGKPGQSWDYWKQASNKSAKANPQAAVADMAHHVQHPAAHHHALEQPEFGNVQPLTAEGMPMSPEDVVGQPTEMTLQDYCLLTMIVLCIAYLIYKLYKACMSRSEAQRNEEEMLAAAIAASQDPQCHEVVVGDRTVQVPVVQAGQQKVVSIQMPPAQANAVSAVQGNAMRTDMSIASSGPGPACPSMFGN